MPENYKEGTLKNYLNGHPLALSINSSSTNLYFIIFIVAFQVTLPNQWSLIGTISLDIWKETYEQMWKKKALKEQFLPNSSILSVAIYF